LQAKRDSSPLCATDPAPGYSAVLDHHPRYHYSFLVQTDEIKRKERSMTRNLKSFGLALVAAVALGAIGAHAASAVVEHSFRSDAEETVATARTESYSNAENKSKDVFTLTPGLTVECYGTYEGKVVGKVVDQVTVHPKYSSCGGGPVHTNGCNLVFDSDTTQASGHSTSSEHAAATLECEAGHVIEITSSGCHIAVGPQTVHGSRYTYVTHSGKSSLTGAITFRTITYTATSGSFCGLAGHAAGVYTNGSIDGKAEATGYVAGTATGSTTAGTTWTHGEQTNISISTPE
jgi:hypothetical protein